MSSGPRGIAFDPRDPRRVYVGSIWGGGLFRSEDGGKHWQRSRKFGPADITVYGVAVDPVDHSVYATASNNGNGLWKSTDYGKTFTRIDRAPNAPAGVYLGLSGHTVTVDPHHHRTVYSAGQRQCRRVMAITGCGEDLGGGRCFRQFPECHGGSDRLIRRVRERVGT